MALLAVFVDQGPNGKSQLKASYYCFKTYNSDFGLALALPLLHYPHRIPHKGRKQTDLRLEVKYLAFWKR